MGTTVGIILAILYVVVQVVTAIAKESAKRKERERIREAQRRVEMGTVAPPPQTATGPGQVDPMLSRPGSISGPPHAPANGPAARAPGRAPAPMGPTYEELAARRREQLEQLRQRREGLRTGRPIGQPPMGGPGGLRSTPNVPTQQRDAIEERRRQLALEAKRAQKARAEQERELAARRQREQERKAEQKRAAAPPSPAPAAQMREARQPVVRTAHAPAGDLRARLGKRGLLRELIILNEIIEPPLSLRRPQ